MLSIIFLSRKKQLRASVLVDQMRIKFENDILKTQIEIQEQTLQEISREIHDNINLSLTLAKLKLNTMSGGMGDLSLPIEMIGKAISELSDLSRSLNTDIIKDCGLISALSMEIERIRKMNPLKVDLAITGTPVFLESRRELFIFRVIQEALNNIIKHSNAKNAYIQLHYDIEELKIQIEDDGCGFVTNDLNLKKNTYPSAGLLNIHKRIEILQGKSKINSELGKGTFLSFSIPNHSNYA